jgi:outer membrane lipoprotein-sorting protein
VRVAVVFLFVFFLGMMWKSEGATRESFVPKKFSAKFTQQYKSQVSGKIKGGNGTLDYEFPSKLRFEMIKPDPIIFITNMTQNWYYRPPFIEGEKGELKKNVKGGNVFADFFDSLSEGLKNNDYYKVKITSDKATITFSEAHGAELGLTSAILWFKSAKNLRFTNLKEITLVYKDERETKIIFDSLKQASNFSKNHFIFK